MLTTTTETSLYPFKIRSIYVLLSGKQMDGRLGTTLHKFIEEPSCQPQFGLLKLGQTYLPLHWMGKTPLLPAQICRQEEDICSYGAQQIMNKEVAGNALRQEIKILGFVTSQRVRCVI